MKLVIFALLLLALTSARVMYRTETQEKRLNAQENNDYDLWFTQKVDHFNPLVKETFQQRFYDISLYWNPEEGPLFLYVCGEGTCRQPGDNSFVVNLAKKHQGRVLALEHRYYGKSQPTEDWSTENLQYLTPDQGLADLAVFATEKSREFSKTYGIPFRRWIVVGGSYPGAMSAWFRSKYPHIAFASLSSSGVVNAIANYHQYDGQVYNSTLKSGEECPQKFYAISLAIEKIFSDGHGDQVIKDLGYNGNEIGQDDVLSFVADLAAGSIQYGSRTSFCEEVSKIGDTYQEVIDWILSYSERLGTDLSEYAISYLQNTTIDFDKNMRQWSYQTCTNLGYFQTPSESTPPTRSQYVDLEFARKTCAEGFGVDIFPDTDHWNTRYGSTDLIGSKIIFTNGGEDPWQHASVTKTDNPTQIPIVIDCDDCAHCVDLGGDHASDPKELTAARAQISKIFGQWIKEELKQEKKFPSEARVTLREMLSS